MFKHERYSVVYPIENLIVNYLIYAGTIVLVGAWTIPVIKLVFIVLSFSLLYLIHVRSRYVTIRITTEGMTLIWPRFFLKGNRVFRFSEMDRMFFQEHARRADPYFNIVIGGKCKKRVRLPDGELNTIKMIVQELGVKTETSKYMGQGMGW